MFDQPAISQTLGKIANWFAENLWSVDTAVQIAIIAGSFVIATIGYRMVRVGLREWVQASDMPWQAKRISQNLIRQILPLIALLVIGFFTAIIGAPILGFKIGMSIIVMKLLLAWMAIRIALQFIVNRFVRNFFAVGIWVLAALSIFGILGETAGALDAIGFSVGEFRLSALAVIKGLFSLFILLYMATFASGFVERRVFKVEGLTRSSQVLIAKSIRITLIVVALLIGVTAAGIDLSLFAVFGGAVGLGIGFGLQKVISNLFSGMLLLMDQSIKPGDVIEMENGTFGWVNTMAARHTELVTRDNKSFLIPNEDFITQRVVNWSHGNTLIRLEVEFGVAYDHNPHEIREIAVKAVTGCHERICEDPLPVCHLTAFGESSLDFKLRFWIKDAEEGVTNIRGAVMLSLWDAFQEHKITIPYPHREVIMREG